MTGVGKVGYIQTGKGYGTACVRGMEALVDAGESVGRAGWSRGM